MDEAGGDDAEADTSNADSLFTYDDTPRLKLKSKSSKKPKPNK